MPYKLKKVGSGYKVCKKHGKQKCFSKKSLPKSRAVAQMKAMIVNEKLSFEDYFYLSEALEFGEDEKGRGYFTIKAPEGHDVFSIKTLIEILKDIKNVDKKKAWEYIKRHSHNFSPLLILFSMIIAMGEANYVINKHPEILKKDPQIVQKAAKFLDQHPEVLRLFK